MRGMALVLILALLGLSFGGCLSMESAAKMLLDASWNAAEKVAEAKLGPLEARIMGGVKERIDSGFGKMSVFVATKTAEQADKLLVKVEAATGVDISSFDTNDDGIIGVSEALEGRRKENEKRKKGGEAPLSLKEIFYLVLAVAGYTGGKSARRVIMKWRGKTNGEAGDPPAVNE